MGQEPELPAQGRHGHPQTKHWLLSEGPWVSCEGPLVLRKVMLQDHRTLLPVSGVAPVLQVRSRVEFGV